MGGSTGAGGGGGGGGSVLGDHSPRDCAYDLARMDSLVSLTKSPSPMSLRAACESGSS